MIWVGGAAAEQKQKKQPAGSIPVYPFYLPIPLSLSHSGQTSSDVPHEVGVSASLVSIGTSWIMHSPRTDLQ